MNIFIEKRIVLEAKYIIENNATVRKTAEIFNMGKSTVHKDMTLRLKEIDLDLYDKVKEILAINLKERHLRGGLATKLKYSKRKK